jgi:hypothetical protein
MHDKKYYHHEFFKEERTQYQIHDSSKTGTIKHDEKYYHHRDL